MAQCSEDDWILVTAMVKAALERIQAEQKQGEADDKKDA